MLPYPFKSAAQWLASIGQRADPLQKINVDILNAVSRPVVIEEAAIVVGATDSLDLTDYAGVTLVSLQGKKSSDGLYENVFNATGFTLVAANAMDDFLINQQNSETNAVNLSGTPSAVLTGVGSSLSWDTGYYSAVFILYRQHPNPTT